MRRPSRPRGHIAWAAQRYHIGGITNSPQPSYWGLTGITARAVVDYYDAVRRDPAVGPWLLNALAHMQPVAADGWPTWGVAAVTTGAQVKQGWVCCLDNVTRIASTGLVDAGRYSVAVLTEGSTAIDGAYGRATVTTMASLLMPGGRVPG